jgi:hypothetical protein
MRRPRAWVRPAPVRVKRRPCLNCDVAFVTTPGVRLCRYCKTREAGPMPANLRAVFSGGRRV